MHIKTSTLALAAAALTMSTTQTQATAVISTVIYNSKDCSGVPDTFINHLISNMDDCSIYSNYTEALQCEPNRFGASISTRMFCSVSDTIEIVPESVKGLTLSMRAFMIEDGPCVSNYPAMHFAVTGKCIRTDSGAGIHNCDDANNHTFTSSLDQECKQMGETYKIKSCGEKCFVPSVFFKDSDTDNEVAATKSSDGVVSKGSVVMLVVGTVLAGAIGLFL